MAESFWEERGGGGIKEAPTERKIKKIWLKQQCRLINICEIFNRFNCSGNTLKSLNNKKKQYEKNKSKEKLTFDFSSLAMPIFTHVYAATFLYPWRLDIKGAYREGRVN